MTIAEAINRIDTLRPNAYTVAEKIAWLNTLDGLIYRNIIKTHFRNCDEEEVTFEGYDEDTPMETELLAYEPYCDLYIYWLESKIDYANTEYDRYNNSAMQYSEMYSAFEKDYNRTHRPKSRGLRYY